MPDLELWGVEGCVVGVVEFTAAVVPSQPQVAAGSVVDTPLPVLSALLQVVGAEGFLHLLIPVGAVTVAVAMTWCFVQQPLQGVLYWALIPLH